MLYVVCSVSLSVRFQICVCVSMLSMRIVAGRTFLFFERKYMFKREGSARLPVHVWVDAHLKPLNDRGVFFYIHQRGEQNSGMILLKLNGLAGKCRVLVQQRNFEGEMGWMNAISKEFVEESLADQYIQRAITRDPDLWVIEIEDREMVNPFEGNVI